MTDQPEVIVVPIEERPIEGAVNHGETVTVSIDNFEGRAGYRERPAGIEVAYVGPPPRRKACEGVVDGRKAQLTLADSANDAIVVWNVVFDAG